MAWLDMSDIEADFERLYRVELPRIYNYFRYRVGDGQLAEDLTSETFEKAWRNRDRYRRDRAAFSTWLFTIARRVGQDHYRKHHAEIPLDGISQPSSDEMTHAVQGGNFAGMLDPSTQTKCCAHLIGGGTGN